MSDNFATIRIFGKILSHLYLIAVLIFLSPTPSLSDDVIPYSVLLSAQSEAVIGDQITFDIIKTGGSETAHAFDFMIGYDTTRLYNPVVTHGELYYIPGDYEWELLGVDMGPFPECSPETCPSGLINVISLAETDNGPYHPKTDPLTGQIKVIPDYTVLFSITFQVSKHLDPAERFVPVYFFWTHCGDNQIAFTYEFDGPFDIRSAFSLTVLDSDGRPGWLEISDFNSVLPSRNGAPDDCIAGTSERLCDYFNGGFIWGCGDTNNDGYLNVLDIIFLINLKYKEGNEPAYPNYGDVNDDGVIDILDIIFLINYIYKDGPILHCPELSM